MYRDIEKKLLAWKNKDRRRPMLLRGARQVGKSYTIEKFGKENFENLVIADFEQQKVLKKCFESLVPKEITQSLSLIKAQQIIPGQTLLFLDEIQDCPEAITALRYFYEQLPELHVIAAGSLLEFAIEKENFKMPVGRVEYLYMKPLSFGEFLNVQRLSSFRDKIRSCNPDSPLPQPLHETLLKHLKKYLITGGMPLVVNEYINSNNLHICGEIQSDIIESFKDDFSKYSSKINIKYLEKVFETIPRLVGKKTKYSRIDNQVKSEPLKRALNLLQKAGVLYKVKRTSGSGLPLGAEASELHFKTIFFDTGLMQKLCGLGGEIILAENIHQINKGAVAEQFAGQELIVYQNNRTKASIYYWERAARNSTAEVDYLLTSNSDIFPVEIKAGNTGTLKSLMMFMEKFNSKYGMKISAGNFKREGKVLSYPLYAIENIITDSISGYRT